MLLASRRVSGPGTRHARRRRRGVSGRAQRRDRTLRPRPRGHLVPHAPSPARPMLPPTPGGGARRTDRGRGPVRGRIPVAVRPVGAVRTATSTVRRTAAGADGPVLVRRPRIAPPRVAGPAVVGTVALRDGRAPQPVLGGAQLQQHLALALLRPAHDAAGRGDTGDVKGDRSTRSPSARPSPAAAWRAATRSATAPDRPS